MNRSIANIVIASVGAVAFCNTANADLVYGLTVTNRLVSFDTATPGSTTSPISVNGLQAGENLLGIDFRPANSTLYALGSTGRLYSVNTGSGQATQVGAGSFAVALNGNNFGVDFNPTVDRLRVTSDARQNLRLNPNTGAVVDFDAATPGVQPDGMLSYNAGDPNSGATPQIVASAYTNNFNGATTTTLYNIDAATGNLVIQGNPPGVSPNSGQLFTVGSLGINPALISGFDIAFSNGAAFLSTSLVGAASGLYRVNLATGGTTFVGAIGGEQLSDIAIIVPTPASIALIAFGAAGVLRRRR